MTILALGLLAALVILLAAVDSLYARRWSRGRPATIDWIAGLRRLPAHISTTSMTSSPASASLA